MYLDIIDKICDEIEKNKEYLTDLDRAIGDGDHGVNLARGTEKIKKELVNMKNLKPYEALNKMAMLLMSNVGGASGALYATALMKGAGALKNKENIGKEEILEAFNEMIKGIEMRGKSTIGEKTMLDTLIPAYDAMKMGTTVKESFKLAKEAAKQGMEKTKDIVATKGRASYLGERSLGHIDPGAMSSYLILKVISEEV